MSSGPAAARNHGAQQARGEILAFTDADCAPAPDWLHAISQPFADPEIIGVKGTYRTHQTGLVPRFPTAILAASIMILATLSLATGLVLDSVARGRREAKRLHYLGLTWLGLSRRATDHEIR